MYREERYGKVGFYERDEFQETWKEDAQKSNKYAACSSDAFYYDGDLYSCGHI